MRLDTFESPLRKGLFLTVPAGTNLHQLRLPADLPSATFWTPFRMNWDPYDPLPRIAMRAADLVVAVTADGYALHNEEVTSRSAF